MHHRIIVGCWCDSLGTIYHLMIVIIMRKKKFGSASPKFQLIKICAKTLFFSLYSCVSISHSLHLYRWCLAGMHPEWGLLVRNAVHSRIVTEKNQLNRLHRTNRIRKHLFIYAMHKYFMRQKCWADSFNFIIVHALKWHHDRSDLELNMLSLDCRISWTFSLDL